MKTYIYYGREYVESGEERAPKRNEVFLTKYSARPILTADSDYADHEKRKILIPEEKRG